MSIRKAQYFARNYVCIDYPFEEAMFRWDSVEKKIYIKFYGQEEKSEAVPHQNRLFNDALLSGNEITRERYEKI